MIPAWILGYVALAKGLRDFPGPPEPPLPGPSITDPDLSAEEIRRLGREYCDREGF